MEPIRVLHVLGGLGLGGAESRIMDLYRSMDRSRVQFDFLIHTKNHDFYYDEVISLGGRVYSLLKFRGYNGSNYKKAVENFFQEHHDFKVVQGHMTSTASLYLPIAKKYNIPITIAHARSAGVDRGIKGLYTKWLRRNLYKKTDYCFACSALAGEAVFGSARVKKGLVTIIPNAIDAGKFTFDPEKRMEMRQNLDISEKFVIGHVGRFDYMKNHTFLIDIFAELTKLQENVVLLLLGEGNEMQMIKDKANALGIQSKILFLGNQGNPQDYYQTFDYFVFPSIFEGLPGTVVEAQAAGLRCLISDTITSEVNITSLVKNMSLKQSPAEWASYILKTKYYKRNNMLNDIKEAGFDAANQAENMMTFYETGTFNLH